MKDMPTRLLVAASEASSDLVYATKFFVPDEMIWFQYQRKSYAVLSPLEIDRARKTAQIDVIMALDEITHLLQKKNPTQKITTKEVLVHVLTSKRIKSVVVPASFPFGYAQGLNAANIQVNIVEPFFPEREIKTWREIQMITRAQRQAEAGLERGIEILKTALIDKQQFIRWGKEKLTSEILRGEIDAAVIKAGGLPAHTIVAGGDQACDPHERGYGFLKANESIIIDIFPRDQVSGYFGDLSRSVVKGRASEALRKLYGTVAQGQRMALGEMKEGVDGCVLHEKIKTFFKTEGYPTEKRKKRWVGFFHGTGHSLGLDIHETPRFSSGLFKASQVMTVEPGLYYPGVGGVRIEDLVVIGKRSVKNLTEAAAVFEI